MYQMAKQLPKVCLLHNARFLPDFSDIPQYFKYFKYWVLCCEMWSVQYIASRSWLKHNVHSHVPQQLLLWARFHKNLLNSSHASNSQFRPGTQSAIFDMQMLFVSNLSRQWFWQRGPYCTSSEATKITWFLTTGEKTVLNNTAHTLLAVGAYCYAGLGIFSKLFTGKYMIQSGHAY